MGEPSLVPGDRISRSQIIQKTIRFVPRELTSLDSGAMSGAEF